MYKCKHCGVAVHTVETFTFCNECLYKGNELKDTWIYKYWKKFRKKREVCREWKTSFTTFLRECGEPPNEDFKFLIRFDNRDEYTLSNSYWAKQQEGRLMVDWQGERVTFRDLCARYDKKFSTAYGQYKRGKLLKEIFDEV